jgi:hypothetical protein
MNWDHIRSVRFTKEPTPQDWPEDIRGISIDGVSLLGVHEKTGKLYWDGKEIRARNMILLGTYERWVAGIAASGAFGSFVVNLGHNAFRWW